MNFPSRFVAGDSLDFSQDAGEYTAADGWSLRLVLINALSKVTLDAAVIGNEHRFQAAANITSAWAPGIYRAVLLAIRDAERVTVSAEDVQICPDPVALNALDNRSEAQKTLDALKAAHKRMIESNGMAQEVEYNGRRTKFRNAEDILQLVRFYEREVANEKAAQNLSAGLGLGGRILTRL